ncbi:DUF3551 domain-containing protein [Rhodoplanes azumiensis]|uniref:DUF3551 domain-containing protein n=1 Tax=Rhodoplanes azumiensis TaxID=1897628 RepID=A0ABW5APY2_9BRAD
MRLGVVVLVAACLVAAGGIGTAPAETPARRRDSGSPMWPWCAEYSMDGAVVNCGFATRAQCMAAVSGNGGGCYRNPFASPARAATPGTATPSGGAVRSSAR